MKVVYNIDTELAESDAILRDCRTDVSVLIGTNRYLLDVIGIERLQYEFESDYSQNGFYNIHTGLIIVKTASCIEIENTIKNLYLHSFFFNLTPTEFIQTYHECDESMLVEQLYDSIDMTSDAQIQNFESAVYWLGRFRKRTSFTNLLLALRDCDKHIGEMNNLEYTIRSFVSCEYYIEDFVRTAPSMLAHSPKRTVSLFNRLLYSVSKDAGKLGQLKEVLSSKENRDCFRQIAMLTNLHSASESVRKELSDLLIEPDS